jgi:hypothetical protein
VTSRISDFELRPAFADFYVYDALVIREYLIGFPGYDAIIHAILFRGH